MEKITNSQDLAFESILESKDNETEGLKRKNADLSRNLSNMGSMKTKLEESLNDKVCSCTFNFQQPYK